MKPNTGAKAIEKNSSVSIAEPTSEALRGGISQKRLRSRENTAMSSNWPMRNAVADAMAMRGVDRNAERQSATANPTSTTARALRGPSKRLVRSDTRNAKG